ncbi:MAG TPA: aspartyl/asparaginyl beta-hydroxylase domain-containing protein [Burkholderiales bacterium]|nr:aspartyl/asparaginyl beta-hydroxylase domain-containing protein [Burkholderiales bacterium]
MNPYHLLPVSLDREKLLADLGKLESGVWHDHPDYTVAKAGTWTAMALISTDGDHTGPESLRYKRGAKGAPTKLLEMCPYFKEVIGAFKTDIHRARLMSLKPGTVISEHRDYGQQRYSIERGMIRVHIPIRTHPDVSWNSSGKKVPMNAGEAWYVNVCQPHSVQNHSDIDRVHLVLDMKVNAWLRTLFPERTLKDRAVEFMLANFERDALRIQRFFQRVYSGIRRKAGDLGLRQLRDGLRGAGLRR